MATKNIGTNNGVFECAFGDRKFSLSISNQQSNLTDISSLKSYTGVEEKLVSAAAAVREQAMFGKIDLRHLALAYAFKPFEYQYENVDRMLNRFEGNGVFGDQVGLGKTIEALMTAHAMFASGVIKNALLVVKKRTIGGWINEIITKFPGIFKIIVGEGALSREKDDEINVNTIKQIAEERGDIVEIVECDVGSSASNNVNLFLSTVKKMKEERSVIRGEGEPFPLYIVTNEMLLNAGDVIDEQNAIAVSYKDITATMTEEEKENIENYFSNLSKKLKEYDRTDIKTYLETEAMIEELGVKYTYFDYINLFSDLSGRLKIFSMIEECLEKVCKRSQDLKERGTPFQKSSNIDNLPYLKGELDRVKSKVSELENTVGSYEQTPNLFSEERIIDLLVIDEIHEVYNTAASAVDTNATLSDFLAKIQKKFCVLISATPVRENLENIFNLLYMANGKKLGDGQTAARDYFYKVLCRFADQGERYPLAKMVLDEKGNVSDEKLGIFLGLVGNNFTRKRVRDVSSQMKGISEKKYAELSEDEKRLIDCISLRLMQNYATAYIKAGAAGSYGECLAAAHKLLNQWKDGLFCFEDAFKHEAMLADEDRCKKGIEKLRADYDTLLSELKELNGGKNITKHEYLEQQELKERVDKLVLEKPYEVSLIFSSAFYRGGSEEAYNLTEEDLKQELKAVAKTIKRFHSSFDSSFIELINCIDDLAYEHSKGAFKSDDSLREFIKNFPATLRAALVRSLGGTNGAKDGSQADYKSGSEEDDILYLDRKSVSAIKDFISESGRSSFIALKQILYSLVDWRRRKKIGVAFLPCESAEGESTEARSQRIMRAFLKAAIKNVDRTEDGSFIFPPDFDNKDDDDFVYSLLLDTVMVYLSKNADGAREDAMKGFKEYTESQLESEIFLGFSNEFGSERIGFYESGGKRYFIGRESGARHSENEVFFVNVNYQAGINLQQYKNFLFYQFDNKRQDLLDPVDIEQWIGRIHRTGQVKDCRILTVLDTYLVGEAARRRYDREFLKWYYVLLADKDGFDLYGNGTPDIAFMQPIVSDCLKLKFTLIGEPIRENDADAFYKIAYGCYSYDKQNGGNNMKLYIRNLIRKLRVSIERAFEHASGEDIGSLEYKEEAIASITGSLYKRLESMRNEPSRTEYARGGSKKRKTGRR